MSKENTGFNYYVTIKNGVRHFEPNLFWVKPTITWIFPVPEPNAIGTLDGGKNSLTFIKFGYGNKKPEYKVIARNFSKAVFGNFTYRFSPIFTDDMIVYSKSRVAVMVNVKTGEAFHAGFNIDMGDFMFGIHPLDPEKNLFAVVKSIEGWNLEDGWFDDMHIARLEEKQLVDLGIVAKHFNETGRITSDASIYVYNRWTIHNKMLFIYTRNTTKELVCYDGFNKTAHPFTEIFNNNKTSASDVRHFAIHPTLPFGIIVDDARHTRPLHFLRWNTNDPDEQFTTINHKLLPLAALFNIKAEYFAFSYPNFSPDGKWLVLGCFQYDMFDEVHFIAIPVDPENPEFLNMDELVVLGFVNGLTSLAWSTNPTAFVVSDGNLLYKWDLGELPNARVIVGNGGDGDTHGRKE